MAGGIICPDLTHMSTVICVESEWELLIVIQFTSIRMECHATELLQSSIDDLTDPLCFLKRFVPMGAGNVRTFLQNTRTLLLM